MTKKELIEAGSKALNFKLNQKLDEVYVASDGIVFVKRADAKEYARKLEDKAVTLVNRDGEVYDESDEMQEINDINISKAPKAPKAPAKVTPKAPAKVTPKAPVKVTPKEPVISKAEPTNKAEVKGDSTDVENHGKK